MRKYRSIVEKAGLSDDRYQELVHHCRQYRRLTSREKRSIDRAIAAVLRPRYDTGADGRAEYIRASRALKRNICESVPLIHLDINYSERQLRRLRGEFFQRLSAARREEAERMDKSD